MLLPFELEVTVVGAEVVLDPEVEKGAEAMLNLVVETAESVGAVM